MKLTIAVFKSEVELKFIDIESKIKKLQSKDQAKSNEDRKVSEILQKNLSLKIRMSHSI